MTGNIHDFNYIRDLLIALNEILLYHQMDHHRNLVTTLFLSSANKQTISKKKKKNPVVSTHLKN